MAMCGEIMAGFGGCWTSWPEPQPQPNNKTRLNERQNPARPLNDQGAFSSSRMSNNAQPPDPNVELTTQGVSRPKFP